MVLDLRLETPAAQLEQNIKMAFINSNPGNEDVQLSLN